MPKNEIERFANNLLDNYLEKHRDVSQLFNCDSCAKDVFTFFFENFGDIYSTMGKIFHENAQVKNEFREEYSSFLEQIEAERRIDSKYYLSAFQKKIIIATLVYKATSQDFSVTDLPIDEMNLINNDGKHWYRGQSDYNWNLMPSMFRNLCNVYTKGKKITINEIADLYEKNGLIDKWKQVFKRNAVDYEFLAYMQHSISYSPLLDFTSDFPTALSFSLGNKSSINDFHYKDASVFQLEVKDQKLGSFEKQLPSDFYIDYLPNSYVIGTPILGMPVKSYQDIIKALTPSFCLIDVLTNDRMKYQNGKFLFFYNYLSIKGNVCSWLNPNLNVTKYKIQTAEKDRWYNKIRTDYPHLILEKMLNPYSYFSD